MFQDRVLSVTQLNQYTENLLRNDALLAGVLVRGELSGFKRHTSGHLYFSLKDDNALIRCVMFRPDALHAPHGLKDGMRIVARGNVRLYVRDGQYQLYVERVMVEGEGELFRRFLDLKAKFEAKGWFDGARKRSLPMLPRCVGVVTSRTGAAFWDIVNVTQRRFPQMDILLAHASVQGESAAEEIANAIRLQNEAGRADVLIVGRGGGSMEDLWPFNEEAVVRAIYESAIPIVSAVGHEIDFSLADFAADVRAPTPSAAAELCVPEYDALMYSVASMQQTLERHMKADLGLAWERLGSLVAQVASRSPGRQAEKLRMALNGIDASMRMRMHGVLDQGKQALGAAGERIRALSPHATIERGFAMVRTEEGRVISEIGGLLGRSTAELIMRGGSAAIRIERIFPEGKEDE